MKPLTEWEKKRLISQLFWDLDVDTNEIDKLINGEIVQSGTISQMDVFYRLLTSFDWYTLLKIVPPERIHQLLDDNVFRKIKSKGLIDKYVYAKRFLSE
jgi:hypothetical protein